MKSDDEEEIDPRDPMGSFISEYKRITKED